MLICGMRTAIISLISNRDGVSAIEFSFVAPILLLVFMATIELPRAYMIGKRLDSSTAAMADLISRKSYTDLTPVFAVAGVISNPYDVSRASIVLTAAGTYQDGTGTVTQVCSSMASNGQARAVGSPLGPPPAGMNRKGDRFVMSEVTMKYRPVFSIFPSLAEWTIQRKSIWPIRGGEVYNGQAEVILPGGRPCPI